METINIGGHTVYTQKGVKYRVFQYNNDVVLIPISGRVAENNVDRIFRKAKPYVLFEAYGEVYQCSFGDWMREYQHQYKYRGLMPCKSAKTAKAKGGKRGEISGVMRGSTVLTKRK